MSKTILLMLALSLFAAHAARAQAPQRVTFPSQDGRTTLAGYLFVPRTGIGRVPAIVMMHGRAGAYSSRPNGVYDATTLSKRHKAWGELWAAQGYVALLVDGSGPRGYPAGFPRHSYDSRPEALNEVTVRPLDAYGALAWLRTRPDVDGARIALQGWSNGGSATLAAMAAGSGFTPASLQGFAAALAFYPACGLKGAFAAGYRPYAPAHVFMGSADEEVSPKRCERFSRRAEPRAVTSRSRSTAAQRTASMTRARNGRRSWRTRRRRRMRSRGRSGSSRRNSTAATDNLSGPRPLHEAPVIALPLVRHCRSTRVDADGCRDAAVSG
jgi:carboxymethylenebutenolidase